VFPGKKMAGEKITVNTARQAVAKKMNNVVFGSSRGGSSDDATHFGTKSIRTFAECCAAAYLEMTSGNP